VPGGLGKARATRVAFPKLWVGQIYLEDDDERRFDGVSTGGVRAEYCGDPGVSVGFEQSMDLTEIENSR
jgi:hypothetical protein